MRTPKLAKMNSRGRGSQGRGSDETLFTKIVDVKPNEIHALLLAFVFNFVVLGGYYVIRPIRDEIGADRGVENLPWMYTGTLKDPSPGRVPPRAAEIARGEVPQACAGRPGAGAPGSARRRPERFRKDRG